MYYEQKNEESKSVVKWIALDPGIKTFLYGVDSNGDTYEFGWGLGEEIKKLQNKYSELQSNPSEVKEIINDRMQKKWERY